MSSLSQALSPRTFAEGPYEFLRRTLLAQRDQYQIAFEQIEHGLILGDLRKQHEIVQLHTQMIFALDEMARQAL